MDSLQTKLLVFPGAGEQILSIRAKALVFNDAKSQAILDMVERVAASDATVLIVGETGTGKELLARHIHECSGRKGKFVAVNCGAFSETLVESELFGHEPGAFTGAKQARAGWFEAADGGTLFLDEVGDMPLSQQTRLLRVLQERQVVRVGSCRPIPVDVRLVAATNVELEKAVEAGHFRKDLYYRLNVAPVDLPPLRERRGDIMPLVRHFMDVYRRRLKLGPMAVSPRAEQALVEYDWPGNIRELENVIHFAMIMCGSNALEENDLRLPRFAGRHYDAQDRSRGHAREDSIESLLDSLQRLLDSDHGPVHEIVQKALITTAYEHTGGNQVRAAVRLGITRNILRAQLKQFGLLGSARQAAH
ncbi:sigma-54-dependent Fis family transcriptional regulator [Herbaspirillum sp. HC18]|nr:sigma-54-dependent Fis family transcriptional regulator [Herbaspirillum sp. HC18]